MQERTESRSPSSSTLSNKKKSAIFRIEPNIRRKLPPLQISLLLDAQRYVTSMNSAEQPFVMKSLNNQLEQCQLAATIRFLLPTGAGGSNRPTLGLIYTFQEFSWLPRQRRPSVEKKTCRLRKRFLGRSHGCNDNASEKRSHESQ